MTGADPAVCFFAVCFVIMAASLCRKLLLALLPQQVDQAVIHKNSKKSTGFIAGGETTVCAAAEPEAAPGQPISINYHFLRSCNYNCGFCFHTAITSHVEPIERAAKALQLFREAGCHKVNFSGGEPFLHEGGEYVGQLCRIAREDLKYSSVSIVSNGSLITEEWFVKYGNFLDILAVSCDSFDDQTNKRIGRMDRTTRTVPHADKLRLISVWCEKYNVRFKINTTVNRHNLDEDFTVHLSKLQPFRWKVFQCLEVQGENKGPGAKRSAASFLVTNEEFDQFVRHHQVSLAQTKVKVVPEDNTAMRASYIILDEFLRLLDCSSGAKKPSDCVLDVGVEKAMQQSGFDQDMFARRGGQYPWRKTENVGHEMTW